MINNIKITANFEIVLYLILAVVISGVVTPSSRPSGDDFCKLHILRSKGEQQETVGGKTEKVLISGSFSQ